MGLYEKGKMAWLHQFGKRTAANFVTRDGKIYLHFVNLNGNLAGVSELYFDNLSISAANMGSATICSYDIHSGTSMAAPVISAAVAVLANYYPSDVATQTRERLMKCVRQTAGLMGYCKSGGVLDLSKVSSATASPVTMSSKIAVKKVKLNKKKATLRYKKKLKLKATITPKNATNKKVKWYSSNKKYATVTGKGVVKAKKKGIGKTVKIYAKAKDGSGKKAYCKVKIKKKK